MVWIRFSIQRVLGTVDGRGEERRGEHLLQRDTACIRDRVSRRHERPTTTTTDAHVPMIYSQFAFLMNNKRRQGCKYPFRRIERQKVVLSRTDSMVRMLPARLRSRRVKFLLPSEIY